MDRPQPPAILADTNSRALFAPAPELERWLRVTFITDDAPLFNSEHRHLQDATLGALWTVVPQYRQGIVIAATCEIPRPTQGSKWQKARLEHQLCEWFGDVPDFLLTFHAGICQEAGDREFCALAEHELYHAGQARDEYGSPRYHRETGRPIWTMRGHDVEEFVGVVRRYGTRLLNPKVRELVEAAENAPEVERSGIALACGSCGLRLV